MEGRNLYTYAFLKKPNILLNLPNGFVTQVLLIDGIELSAIVETGISLEQFQNNDEQLIQMVLCHDRVLRELFQQITVLPLRFGTYFDSTQNLLEHLELHTKEYQNKLEKINNKAEYNLKLIPRNLEEPEKPFNGVGKDYFLAKKQRYETQKKFVIAQSDEKSKLIDLIKQIYQSSVIIQHAEEETQIYILVNHEDKDLLLEKLCVWQKACPRWNLILGEGLPPYHFI